MADVINLNKARKARRRQESRATAAENRVRFGQNKSARNEAREEAERLRRDIDGKKLE